MRPGRQDQIGSPPRAAWPRGRNERTRDSPPKKATWEWYSATAAVAARDESASARALHHCVELLGAAGEISQPGSFDRDAAGSVAVDFEQYMPECWANDPARRAEERIPDACASRRRRGLSGTSRTRSHDPARLRARDRAVATELPVCHAVHALSRHRVPYDDGNHQPPMPDETTFHLDLTPDERRLLRFGLTEWGGPARCTDELANVIGFNSTADLNAKTARLVTALHEGEALTAKDWRRTLLATEIAFASDVVGSGIDSSTTTGLSDEQTIRLLRAIQRKFHRPRPKPDLTQ